MASSTHEGGGLYADKPFPVSWERSRYNPKFVFVKAVNADVAIGCTQCAFRRGQENAGCNEHPCLGGAWLHETEAAILRLER